VRSFLSDLNLTKPISLEERGKINTTLSKKNKNPRKKLDNKVKLEAIRMKTEAEYRFIL